MTGMMDYFDKHIDESNEPEEANDNPPDFEKSLVSEECPFCHNADLLFFLRKKIHPGSLIINTCPLCKRSWAFELNDSNNEIIIMGEVDFPFFDPDNLE